MSLTLSTLLVGLILLGLGSLLLASNSAIIAMFKALPRSRTAAFVFFGGGSAWFTYQVAGMSAADVILFSSPTPFVFLFAALAVLSFIYLPEFLAVLWVALEWSPVRAGAPMPNRWGKPVPRWHPIFISPAESVARPNTLPDVNRLRLSLQSIQMLKHPSWGSLTMLL